MPGRSQSRSSDLCGPQTNVELSRSEKDMTNLTQIWHRSPRGVVALLAICSAISTTCAAAQKIQAGKPPVGAPQPPGNATADKTHPAVVKLTPQEFHARL